MKQLAGLVLLLLLVLAPGAQGGGISDDPCPNLSGENTNTCPSGTVGEPYAITFVEREGSGCGSGRQTFFLDSGLAPPGFALTPDGTLSGVTYLPGTYRFYVEMREPTDDPEHCAGKRTQKQFTLTVRREPWIVPRPALPPRSEVGVPFRMVLRARGGSGYFAWRLRAGRLPGGLHLGTDGLLTGTPRQAGSYRFQAEARDTESRVLDWSASVNVSPRLRIVTRELPSARIGHSYEARLVS